MSTMARGKTRIALIADEKVLKSTFQKRKKGLIKKAMELATLCDIVACVVIYGPTIGGKPPEIFTWPEEHDKVLVAIRMYKEKMDHSRRTTDLCNYLKDRRRVDGAYHSAGYVVEGFPERQQGNLSITTELATAYLNWIDERIKAVAERIELVKSSVMRQNIMLDDMMLMPPAMPNQDQNFGHESMQEWCYAQNLCQDFSQFDLGSYDDPSCPYDPLCALPDTIQFQPHPITCHQQKQILFQNFDQTHAHNENKNQVLQYDPYLLRMDFSNLAGLKVNGGQCYHQQHGENMQHSNNVTPQPLIPRSNMDDRMQLCPFPDERSGSNASSTNYSISSSNHFSKTAIDAPNFDDDLELFFARIKI